MLSMVSQIILYYSAAITSHCECLNLSQLNVTGSMIFSHTIKTNYHSSTFLAKTVMIE